MTDHYPRPGVTDEGDDRITIPRLLLYALAGGLVIALLGLVGSALYEEGRALLSIVLAPLQSIKWRRLWLWLESPRLLVLLFFIVALTYLCAFLRWVMG